MHSAIGQNWLLLRGLSREAAHWGDFLPLMQAYFPNARISTLDLPGTGQCHQETSPCSIAEITESVRKQALQQALLDRPLTLIGLSLGGMVSWEWMLRYPEDICGAALINTSLAGLSPFYQRLRWQSYPNFFKLIVQPSLYLRELAIVQTVVNRRDRDQDIATEWANIQNQRPVRFSNTLNQIVAAARYCPEVKKPETQILLLTGKGDRLVAPACSYAIQKKWHIPLLSHPWGGHDLTSDDGAWVAARLQEWVVQIGNQFEIN